MNITKLIAGLMIAVVAAINIFVPPFDQIGHDAASETAFIWEIIFSFLTMFAGVVLMVTSVRNKRTY